MKPGQDDIGGSNNGRVLREVQAADFSGRQRMVETSGESKSFCVTSFETVFCSIKI
jgi:hypothetical protein